MHTQDTINRFLELRALGQTLFSISEELKVPISTLGDWNKRHAQHLAHERAVKWEHCENGAGLNIEADLIRLARRIYTCELELGRRPLHEMKTSELLKLLSQSRREYFRRRDPFLKPLNATERPAPRDPSRSASAESESHDTSSAYAANDVSSSTQDSRHSTLDSVPSSAYAANDSQSTTHIFSTASETNHFQSSSHGQPLFLLPGGEGQDEGQTSSVSSSPPFLCVSVLKTDPEISGNISGFQPQPIPPQQLTKRDFPFPVSGIRLSASLLLGLLSVLLIAPVPPATSHLKGLDYSVVQQCMHCGMCLPTCPTYEATKLERNSPRGRIALMRAIADDNLSPTQAFADEMYFCLGCLACMTACPAGVNYAELFEHARAEAEQSGVLDSGKRSLIRAFTLRWLFMDLSRLQLVGRILRLYQQLGIQTFIRRSGILKLLPKRLRELEAMTPAVLPNFSADIISPVTPALSQKRFRVALLTGCAQDLIFSDVNRDTAEVLARNGCEVITPSEQQCCGSLHAHNGEWTLAQQLARKQIDQFPPEQFDAIITNAAGCGSHLKHYAKLLADDPVYAKRAHLWDEKVKDIHEWLAEIGIAPPSSSTPQTVTYHEACHLCHGQKITAQPRALLRSIPNLKLVELPESTWCCGSAGIYNLIQPEMAGDLLDRKLNHIKSTGAPIVATGNPGCLLQILNGARQQNLPLRVAHPITLLAEAYRGEALKRTSPSDTRSPGQHTIPLKSTTPPTTLSPASTAVVVRA